VELGVLETHVNHCVQEAVQSRDAASIREKIEEMLRVLSRVE